jgi:hypothetical protein
MRLRACMSLWVCVSDAASGTKAYKHNAGGARQARRRERAEREAESGAGRVLCELLANDGRNGNVPLRCGRLLCFGMLGTSERAEAQGARTSAAMARLCAVRLKFECKLPISYFFPCPCCDCNKGACSQRPPGWQAESGGGVRGGSEPPRVLVSGQLRILTFLIS